MKMACVCFPGAFAHVAPQTTEPDMKNTRGGIIYVRAGARLRLILTIIQYECATANRAPVNKPQGELSGMCKLTRNVDPLQGSRFF